jgi:hypothetical protein
MQAVLNKLKEVPLVSWEHSSASDGMHSEFCRIPIPRDFATAARATHCM